MATKITPAALSGVIVGARVEWTNSAGQTYEGTVTKVSAKGNLTVTEPSDIHRGGFSRDTVRPHQVRRVLAGPA